MSPVIPWVRIYLISPSKILPWLCLIWVRDFEKYFFYLKNCLKSPSKWKLPVFGKFVYFTLKSHTINLWGGGGGGGGGSFLTTNLLLGKVSNHHILEIRVLQEFQITAILDKSCNQNRKKP